MVAEPWDAAGQQVTCKDCRRTYTCTPYDDYWARDGEVITGPDTGRCWACLMASHGINADATPVLVVDQDMNPLDPRSGRG